MKWHNDDDDDDSYTNSHKNGNDDDDNKTPWKPWYVQLIKRIKSKPIAM